MGGVGVPFEKATMAQSLLIFLYTLFLLCYCILCDLHLISISNLVWKRIRVWQHKFPIDTNVVCLGCVLFISIASLAVQILFELYRTNFSVYFQKNLLETVGPHFITFYEHHGGSAVLDQRIVELKKLKKIVDFFSVNIAYCHKNQTYF